MDCSAATISSFYKQWKYDPTLSSTLERYRNKFNIFQKGKARDIIVQRSTSRRVKQLTEILKDNPFLLKTQMAQALKRVNPVEDYDLTKQAINRYLKLGNFKPQKLKETGKNRNSTENIEQRRQFALKLKQVMQKTDKYYFYDEFILHRYFDRDSVWAANNEELEIKGLSSSDSS